MRILLTGYSDLNSIIGSINDGEIFRFVNKPWANEELTSTVARAVTAARGSQTAAAKPAEAATAPPAMPGVLVVDDDPTMPEQVRKLLGAEFRVHGATSLDQAVGMLEQQKIGVVISDTRVQDHPVVTLVSTLKEHHPELVTVILTDRADAGSAIDLINRGQIYRFISKPLHGSQCKIAVNSAVRQHHRLSQAPELHQRYQVERAPAAAATAAAGTATIAGTPSAGLLERIRSLRAWVKRA
jgi:DNA-binding NtrC family response regulator